jgi:hypothetical protein
MKINQALETKIVASLGYDPDTGRITRLVTRGNQKAGSVAGWFDARGYQWIDCGGRKLSGHRVAFFLMAGTWPGDVVDHINGNPSDNRWANLRACSQAENARSRMNNAVAKSGVRGVRFNLRSSKSKPWEVLIKKNYKQIYVGRYATKEEAIAARYAASAKYHGEFAGRIENEKPISFKETP